MCISNANNYIISFMIIEIEDLLDSYKQKLVTVQAMIQQDSNVGSTDLERSIRLRTKASCYRSIIDDIERTIARQYQRVI